MSIYQKTRSTVKDQDVHWLGSIDSEEAKVGELHLDGNICLFISKAEISEAYRKSISVGTLLKMRRQDTVTLQKETIKKEVENSTSQPEFRIKSE